MLRFDGKKNLERRKLVEEGLHFNVYVKTALTYATQIYEDFEVDTLEGLHTGKAGDYLAIGPAGEMYPIDRQIFTDSYEQTDNA